MTNDDLGMYQEFAAEMAATNHYAAGRAWESVGYTTNGEADDWGWGDIKAVSLTIEVGSQGLHTQCPQRPVCTQHSECHSDR